MPKNPTVRTLFSFFAAIVVAAGLFKLVAAYERYVADSQWYLLDPPSVGEDVWQSDQSAPLSEWNILESYGSRKECETARARKIAQFAKESESVKASKEWESLNASLRLDRCVAANARGIPHSDYYWNAHPEYVVDMNPPPSNALSRLLNHVAADSRTHPGMSLSKRLIELWVPLLFLAFFVYGLIGAFRPRVARGVSRIGGLFSSEFETREVNYIAARMACDELKANGWDLDSEDGRKMIYPGAVAHILDAAYEFDCRWDVQFTRWIRGLPSRKRFASAVATLRDIRKEAQQRRNVAPESTQEPPPSNDPQR